MKCISCETEINPKWKHAIDINVCPFCGEHIMEEHLKNCIAGLAAAMEDMKKYPEQLDDWLLSNFSYIRTDSPDLKLYLPKDIIKEMRKEIDDEEFHEKKKSVVKIKVPDGDGGFTEEEITVEKVQSENRTQTFHERANNMLKQEKAVDGEPKSISEKTKNLRSVAEKSRKEVDEFKKVGVVSLISDESMADADPEAVAEFQAAIGSGDVVSSGLPPVSNGDDDEIPSVVLAMANASSKKGIAHGGANEKDIAALRKMHANIQGGASRLNSGKGSFSRG